MTPSADDGIDPAGAARLHSDPERTDLPGPKRSLRTNCYRVELSRWLVPALTALLLGLSRLAWSDVGTYERDIQPLLKARCYACHGVLKQEGGLRLDTGSAIRQGGDSGASIVAGDPARSLLWAKVTADEPEERMPPEGEPLTAAQREHLRGWIADGAQSPASERPESEPDDHWSFQPPQRATLPRLSRPPRSGNAIDAFLDAELARHQLTPRPAAPKHVQLRRVYLDLIGLPPTRDELEEFLADHSPDAYERVVDRLLCDTRHGERWGRHWMDVWRYSDWYGRRSEKDVRNSASQIYRWRDWIVRSVNHARGYDRMVQEMLAADELFPEDYNAGVATGFLVRNYYSLNPNDWMRSTVEHTGKAFLGLTFNCAHCHDHKYDPIEQVDYFRMRAFFEPLFIRQDRVAGEPDPGQAKDYSYAVSQGVQRWGAVRVYDRNLDASTWFYSGGDERNRRADRGSIPPGIPAILQSALLSIEPVTLPPLAWYPGLRTEIQGTMLADAQRAVSTAEESLRETSSDVHRKLAESRVAAAQAELADLQCRIAAERGKYLDSTSSDRQLQLVRDASRAERQAKLFRSESDVLVQQVALLDAESKPAEDAQRAKEIEKANQGLAMARAGLESARGAIADQKLDETYAPLSTQFPRESSGRRRALALWITRPEHPLTARVAVNHLWMRHFQTPLVASVYDFGRNGARPTHPELLDWLAVEFIESGWDMKRIHRQIVTSAAYRRVSSVGDAHQALALDPENRLLWRMNSWRMESEVVRDSLLSVANRLDLTQGGVELENAEALTTNRRTLYYSCFPESGGKSELGELFDAPDPLDCYRRASSIVPQQALALTNSELVHQTSVSLVETWTRGRGQGPGTAGGDAIDRFIEDLFAQILCRAPSSEEQRICRETLERQRDLATEPDSPAALTSARESLARILFNHNDFVTVR